MLRYGLRKLALFFLLTLCAGLLQASRLVLLHTNDTHSQIDVTDNGLGGIERRKTLIDSVRAANDNVLLVDAGDMLQGTLYFTLFGGEVEAKLMNHLGYDIQILGNHEFDNGVKALAKVFGNIKAAKLSTNYEFSDSTLGKLFRPYMIKEFDGKRIAFIAINLDPHGMIADNNRVGVEYLDGIKAANATAWHLKHNEKVDMVIALTHIGYNEEELISDVKLAKSSEDIDIIIGGHSHTVIDPASEKSEACLVDNALGKPVLVAQTGKSGVNVGEIDIDLDNLKVTYKLLPVDSRYDKRTTGEIDRILAPYKTEVDSFLNYKIGSTDGMKRDDWSLVNWMADFVLDDAAKLTDRKPDLSIVNRGGIRRDMQPGVVTKGTIMQIFPFENRTVVMDVPGDKLRRAFEIMARRGGDGVSKGVDITFDPATGNCSRIIINGKALDDNKTYRVATIDYLARGGDYMVPLAECGILAASNGVLYENMIDTLMKSNKKLKADKTRRMHN